MSEPSEPTLENAKDYISNMELSRIIEKMMSYQGWLKKDILAVSNIYRNYLFLQKKYGKEYHIVPSEEVDEFWHNHILDTQSYQKDCKNIFGYYLHHYPYFGIDEESNSEDLNSAFQKTLSLYVIEFGEDSFAYRRRNIFKKTLWFIKRKIVKLKTYFNKFSQKSTLNS